MKRTFISILAAAAILAAACGTVYAEDGYTPPHEHEWEFVSHTDYTCTEDGYDLYVCKTCGEEDRRITDEASHRNELVSETDPDCENGGEQVFVCSVCGEKTVITTPALGHDWRDGETVKKPTLFTKGALRFVCKRNDAHVRYEDIPSELASSPAAAASFFSVLGAAVLALLTTGAKILFDKIKKRRSPEIDAEDGAK